jgi:Mn-dependent DtxR family transcriptional regulator
MSRLIITPKDVEVILEVSPSYARRVVRLLKRKYNKEKHQKITISEFCRTYGLEIAETKQELEKFYKRK